MTAVGEAALAYAAAGYAVVPLQGKLPLGNCPACEPRSRRYRPHQANECGHELCHGPVRRHLRPGTGSALVGQMAAGQHRRPRAGQTACEIVWAG